MDGGWLVWYDWGRVVQLSSACKRGLVDLSSSGVWQYYLHWAFQPSAIYLYICCVYSAFEFRSRCARYRTKCDHALHSATPDRIPRIITLMWIRRSPGKLDYYGVIGQKFCLKNTD